MLFSLTFAQDPLQTAQQTYYRDHRNDEKIQAHQRIQEEDWQIIGISTEGSDKFVGNHRKYDQLVCNM